MKRILLGLIVVALIFGLTACSPDQYQNLGNAMGKMSGNIYGIPANLKDVDNANNKISGAVTVNGSDVTVTIDASTAQSIVSSVVAVKNSDTKIAALKSSLSETILGEGASDALKSELKDQITAQAEACKITDTTGFDEVQETLAELLNAVIDGVSDSLSDNPTKAELATVAVLATLSEAVKSGDEATYIEAGLTALDALKLTTEVGEIDIFASISVSGLLEMLDKSISRDGEEEIDIFAAFFEGSVSQIVSCITENGEFTEQRYNKFVMECKAIRASYEMIAKSYDIDLDSALRGQASVDSGLVIEDLGHYLVAVVFSAVDNYVADIADYLDSFVDEYNGAEEFDLADADMADFFDAILDGIKGSDVAYDEENDFGDMVMEIVRDENSEVGSKIGGVLQTIGVILLDSEYEGILDQIEVTGENAPAEGSLRRFLYASF